MWTGHLKVGATALGALRDVRVPFGVGDYFDYLRGVQNVDMYSSLVNPNCSRVSRLI